MSQILDQLRKEISTLEPEERYDLWKELWAGLGQPGPGQDRVRAEARALWDQEIATRVAEIEGGAVELVSMGESDRQVAAIFAAHDIALEPGLP